jgi:serine/threonine-protein kinase
MGTVYEAKHKALGKHVVVKLLLPRYADDPRLVERLEREARVLARMASPHIVTVSDLGRTPAGATYIVMERLRGRTLGAELRERGPLPVGEAIRWTRQILSALAAAHRSGVVHRDVKLENVFLCDAEGGEPRRIKLLDFGIAKVLKEATAGMDPSRCQPTAEGTLLGSPRWLSPEQARGKAVDGRTDVYAVGLVLYTLLAGRGPFSHIQDPIDALKASLGEQPRPPSQLAPQDLPAGLDDAILMAVARAPEDRFQTAEAFSAALESIAGILLEMTQPLPAGRVLARQAPPSGPSAAEARDPTAPTLLAVATPPAAARAASESTAPTLVRPAGAGAPSPAPSKGRRAAVFLGLTAASTVFFSIVLAVLVHLTGGR